MSRLVVGNNNVTYLSVFLLQNNNVIFIAIAIAITLVTVALMTSRIRRRRTTTRLIVTDFEIISCCFTSNDIILEIVF